MRRRRPIGRVAVSHRADASRTRRSRANNDRLLSDETTARIADRYPRDVKPTRTRTLAWSRVLEVRRDQTPCRRAYDTNGTQPFPPSVARVWHRRYDRVRHRWATSAKPPKGLDVSSRIVLRQPATISKKTRHLDQKAKKETSKERFASRAGGANGYAASPGPGAIPYGSLCGRADRSCGRCRWPRLCVVASRRRR